MAPDRLSLEIEENPSLHSHMSATDDGVVGGWRWVASIMKNWHLLGVRIDWKALYKALYKTFNDQYLLMQADVCDWSWREGNL